MSSHILSKGLSCVLCWVPLALGLMACEVTAPRQSLIVFGEPDPQDGEQSSVSDGKGDDPSGSLRGTEHSGDLESGGVEHTSDPSVPGDGTQDLYGVDGPTPHRGDRSDDRDDSESPMAIEDSESMDALPLVIQLHATDMWGQPLRSASIRLENEYQESLISAESERYIVHHGGEFRAFISAGYYDSAELRLEYDGEWSASGVSVWRANDVPFGFALHSEWVDSEYRQQVLHIYVGLPHRYFASSGSPIRHGGQFRFLMDGQSAWSRVHEALVDAQSDIHLTAWWWESDFELIRPSNGLDERSRSPHTILSVLEGSPARKRVLLWSHPSLSQFNVDDALIEHARQANDVEVLGIHNSTSGRFFWSMPEVNYLSRLSGKSGVPMDELVTDRPVYLDIDDRWVNLADLPLNLGVEHASFHQKTITVDGDTAFVGGMNLKSTDWDTSHHLIYDPRRMYFDSDRDDRWAVGAKNQRSDVMPRKDYMVQLMGNIVLDVDGNFQTLWQQQMDSRTPYAHNATPAPSRSPAYSIAQGASMQIVRTMPAPHHDYSVLETYLNAVRNARDYILIEDQYWRAPLLADAIMSRMAVRPSLKLVVITNSVNEWSDPGCFWTATTHQWLQDTFPDRYHTVKMASFAARNLDESGRVAGEFQDVFIHSKLMIVDDVFLTVGSANTNHRGFLYEYEMNVNILGRSSVQPIRQRILTHLLGAESALHSDDWIAQLVRTSSWNAQVQRWWTLRDGETAGHERRIPRVARPIGFPYPLHIGSPQDCFIESIGQDVTGH